MEKKAVVALITCWLVFSFAKVKTTEKEKINWLRIEDVNVKMKTDHRPVIIDLYTNWCYWCKVMDKKTYNNNKVISYINTHFYAVKINAETKEPLEWNGHLFNYNPDNKINDFALYVTQGQLAFPNTVVFPDMQKDPASIPGYMKPGEMEILLTYFGEGIYKKQHFDEYAAHFKTTW